MNKTTLLTIAATLTVPGCLARTVAPLASEHAAQTQVVADKCREANKGYADAPCSAELQEDLDETAAQAKCIEAVMHGKTCDGGRAQ